MRVTNSISSPNLDAVNIDVQFLIIHYTAGSLKRVLSLFQDPQQEVSAHIIISEKGEIFEVVRCLNSTAHRAWHAGKSRWNSDGEVWEEFNDFSLGVELVNVNGNIVPYTTQQYEALVTVINHLKTFYPALNSPTRILGHEHIAGWRGKADPGRMFDWQIFFKMAYPLHRHPPRDYICPAELQESLKKLLAFAPG